MAQQVSDVEEKTDSVNSEFQRDSRDNHIIFNGNQFNIKIPEGFKLNYKNEYVIYEQNDLILFNSIFKNGNTSIEFSIFNLNNDYTDLYTWVSQYFGPFLVNEDNFSFRFNDANEVIKENVLITKFAGNYYYNKFFKFENKLLVFIIPLSKDKYFDWSEINELVSFKGKKIKLHEQSTKVSIKQNQDLMDKFVVRKEILQQNYIDDTQSLNVMTPYYLPWTKSETYQITQDWCANDAPNTPCASHSGLPGYAYDFGISEGTPIRASNEGVVTFAQGSYTQCGGSTFANYANYIAIKHPDNTTTIYVHLKATSVTVGMNVSRGQLIGLSGKTGWSNCTQHLHFQREVSGSSYWTQSMPIIFVEYPNQGGDGEIPYPTMVTSQNEELTGCNGQNVVLQNWNTNGPVICSPISSITIQPSSNLNPVNGNIIITPSL
jgi:hypothetical protein